MPEAASRWTYAIAFQTLSRWHVVYTERKTLGRVRTMDQLIDVLNTERGKANFGYKLANNQSELKHKEIRVGKAKHLLFWDENMVNLVSNSRTWHLDATYRAIPRVKGAMQLLTIMGRVKDQVRSKNLFSNLLTLT